MDCTSLLIVVNAVMSDPVRVAVFGSQVDEAWTALFHNDSGDNLISGSCRPKTAVANSSGTVPVRNRSGLRDFNSSFGCSATNPFGPSTTAAERFDQSDRLHYITRLCDGV